MRNQTYEQMTEETLSLEAQIEVSNKIQELTDAYSTADVISLFFAIGFSSLVKMKAQSEQEQRSPEMLSCLKRLHEMFNMLFSALEGRQP